MTAIILAGGKSSRMGFDKAFIRIGGIALIKRQIKLLQSFFKEIIIVTNTPHKYRLSGVRVVGDVIPGQGPLGGIYSGLTASGSFYNFVVACDMPYLNLGLIKYMFRRKDNYDAVVPRLQQGYEPLFAVYSKACLPKIEEILKTGDLKVRRLFQEIKLRRVTQKEMAKFGNPQVLFMNINNKAGLVKIKKAQRDL